MIAKYPGSKNGAGIYQTIINEMPPHDLYVEAFVGSGAILRRKRPAPCSIVIDADADVARHWMDIASSGEIAGLTAIHGDARSAAGSTLAISGDADVGIATSADEDPA